MKTWTNAQVARARKLNRSELRAGRYITLENRGDTLHVETAQVVPTAIASELLAIDSRAVVACVLRSMATSVDVRLNWLLWWEAARHA